MRTQEDVKARLTGLRMECGTCFECEIDGQQVEVRERKVQMQAPPIAGFGAPKFWRREFVLYVDGQELCTTLRPFTTAAQVKAELGQVLRE